MICWIKQGLGQYNYIGRWLVWRGVITGAIKKLLRGKSAGQVGRLWSLDHEQLQSISSKKKKKKRTLQKKNLRKRQKKGGPAKLEGYGL